MHRVFAVRTPRYLRDMAKSSQNRTVTILIALIAIVIAVLQALDILPSTEGDVDTPTDLPSTGTGSGGSGGGAVFYGGQPAAKQAINVLVRKGYTVGYDEARQNPAWVAYHLKGGPRYDSGERPGDFDVDPDTKAQVRHGDYTRSGYDRGHMAPNYAIATRYGEEAQLETFLMSNIIPQSPDLNRGPWRMLEEKVASDGGYAEELGEVWVVTGPVFSSKPKTLPNTEIAIPDACFKIIVDEQDGKPRALAVIMPQDLPDGAEWSDYLTSIDEIEQRTGIDFLPQLDASLETALEKQTAATPW